MEEKLGWTAKIKLALVFINPDQTGFWVVQLNS